jgi:hypothetical protein
MESIPDTKLQDKTTECKKENLLSSYLINIMKQ